MQYADLSHFLRRTLPMLRRVLLLGVLLLWCPEAVPASERPTLAVLPFSIAKNHTRYRWLGTASASSLAERLRRVPSVRVLATGRTVHEIQAAGVSPDEVAWAPTSIRSPLGRLLEADILVIGSIGWSGDLDMAGAFLGLPEPPEPLERPRYGSRRSSWTCPPVPFWDGRTCKAEKTGSTICTTPSCSGWERPSGCHPTN